MWVCYCEGGASSSWCWYCCSSCPKKVLQFAGIEDVFTSSRGSTKTLGNFVKETFDYLMKTYGFLTPDFWKEPSFTKSPFQEYFDILAKPANKVIVYATEEAAPERFEA
uniref:40S ribosomal protein S2 n=1 Tax=Solanum tuberosum TaxID=4113 RepID=M1A283_SOLTU